jgi:hypothetical protein
MPHEGVCHAGRLAKRPYGFKMAHRPEQVEQSVWGEAAQEIDWIVPAKRVFDPNAGLYGRWFGGVCNTCWNAVDRDVIQGLGERTAIIYDSPLAGQKRYLTRSQRLCCIDEPEALAGRGSN